jgi:predicted ABC-type ATPase
MTKDKKRVRMFAGPNGSGKSTIKQSINSELFGVYINPDEIEKEIREREFLDFQGYEVNVLEEEILPFFERSPFLQQVGLQDEASALRFADDKLIFRDVAVNAYFASVAADFIRHKLLETGKSFTFETVMSSPDKVEFLQKAQSVGYRTYLYYVATEDPAINISRVQNRVVLGGHPVPEDKIIARYHRSLDLLAQAVQATDRAYIFDNSGPEHLWIAEVTNGKELEMKTSQMPAWFKKALWDKFAGPAN